MSLERAREHLAALGLEDRIRLFEVSSATVELAARAVGCEPARIAKTLSFEHDGRVILIVAAGDARIDNSAFKKTFHCKAKMPSPETVAERVGHGVGGVCPFGIPQDVGVYLDESLRRFEIVYPACGTGNSAVELTIPELERAAKPAAWVDVCRGWRTEDGAEN